MTKDQAENLKNTIDRGYREREDYPPFAIAAWEDRNRYREYVFRIIDEAVEREGDNS